MTQVKPIPTNTLGSDRPRRGPVTQPGSIAVSLRAFPRLLGPESVYSENENLCGGEQRN